jgi:hypothetical protein
MEARSNDRLVGLLIAVSFLFAPRRLMDGAVIVSAHRIGGSAIRLNFADRAPHSGKIRVRRRPDAIDPGAVAVSARR